MEAGGKQGDQAKIADARDIQDIFVDLLEESLSPAPRQAMVKTRYEYALLKNLVSRSGTISADGTVNPATLRNILTKGGKGLQNRHAKSLIRSLETADYLTRRIAPSSGTAERLLANPQGALVKAAPIGISGTLGAGIATGAMGLLGD